LASTKGQDEGAGIPLSAKFSPISQLSAKFLVISQPTVKLNKSQLMMFPQFYFLVFFIKKKISGACINNFVVANAAEHILIINMICSAAFATK